MPETITIAARFNGPLESGQGGYSAGLVAGFLEGAAEVSLRAPVPLDRSLEVVREGERSVRVLAGETLVAEGRAAPEFELGVPAPVTHSQARAATERYRGPADGPSCKCFVCGRGREDSLGVFAGAVEGRDLVATPWTPPAWTAGEDGRVRPEFVWAVLDCPTYFAQYAHEDDLPTSVLARMTARIDGTVAAGQEHVVIAWPLERDGRKHDAGAALLSPGGAPVAVARTLMIERG